MNIYSKFALFIGLASIFPLTACQNDDAPTADKDGYIMPTAVLLTVDDEIRVARADAEVTASDLALTISSASGDYTNTWKSITEYDPKTKFEPGSYTISVAYGDNDSEGFDVPAYYDSHQVEVTKGKTTNVSLKAKLTKAMVSVTYTDAFTSYISTYSANVTTAVQKAIEFAQGETRAAYITPGTTSVNISFTTQSGKTDSQQVAQFQAKAHCHYHVKVDLANSAGGAKIVVSVDDSLASQDVIIDLKDLI